ncbi:MAG: O-antigen ligase family protein [Deltaproteobacteria bacterium]|nr:O-antigen ligase family protein [Deltaproteobacteria bacterium]
MALTLSVAIAVPTNPLLPLSAIITGMVILILLIHSSFAFLYFVPLLLSLEYRVELNFISFALGEISAVLVWLVALLQIWNNRKVYLSRSEVILVLFIATAALPSVGLESDTRHALSVYRDLILPLVFFAGFLLIRLNRQQVIKLLKIFVLAATASAILGIIQFKTGHYLWTMRFEDVWWQNFKTDFIRSSMIGQLLNVKDTLPVGLYATTNNFASYLVIPAVCAFALATFPLRSRSEKLVWRMCSVTLFVALLFTFSRGSLFTFLVACLPLVWFQSRKYVSLASMFFVIGISVLIIAAILVTGILSWDQLGTLQGRAMMLQAGVELIKDHPEALLTGGFTEEYRTYYYQPQLAHNVALYAILQFGLLATLGWLFLVWHNLRIMWSGIKSENDIESKLLGMALLSGLFATVFLYAQTTSFIDNVQSSMWLFFWIGVGRVLIHHKKFRVFQENSCRTQRNLLAFRTGIRGEEPT